MEKYKAHILYDDHAFNFAHFRITVEEGEYSLCRFTFERYIFSNTHDEAKITNYEFVSLKGELASANKAIRVTKVPTGDYQNFITDQLQKIYEDKSDLLVEVEEDTDAFGG